MLGLCGGCIPRITNSLWCGLVKPDARVVGAERRQLWIVFEIAVEVAESEALYKHTRIVDNRETIATGEGRLEND